MTEFEAINYIENSVWSSTRLGLERITELMELLGNPQKKLKFIHVTGSNGKGSTCAMLASVLQAAGYTTGLFISPYITCFNECMQVNGNAISGDDLADITEKIRVAADSMWDHPSKFELTTAVAFEYFLEKTCDIVVLEVGMGGALDSTNVIDAPEAAVFTNIGLEHTEYLGDTLEAITAVKGGIIKKGCNCVIYDGNPIVTKVLEDICREKQVNAFCSDFSRLHPLSHSFNGQLAVIDHAAADGSALTIKLPLLGEHQLHNLSLAITVIEVLRKRNWCIPDSAVLRGIENTKWPARFQLLSEDPCFILDGGHNPQCAESMVQMLEQYLPGTKVTFLMGVLADKDYERMLDLVCPFAERFFCITPPNPRALPAKTLSGCINARGIPAMPCISIPEGIRLSISFGSPVIAFGSLYSAGEILDYFS